MILIGSVIIYDRVSVACCPPKVKVFFYQFIVSMVVILDGNSDIGSHMFVVKSISF